MTTQPQDRMESRFGAAPRQPRSGQAKSGQAKSGQGGDP
jgi:hypothetical protein